MTVYLLLLLVLLLILLLLLLWLLLLLLLLLLWLLLLLLLLLLLRLLLLLLLPRRRRSVLLLSGLVGGLSPRWVTSASRVCIPSTLVSLPGVTLTSAFLRVPRHLFLGQHRIIPGHLLVLVGVPTPSSVRTVMR